MRNVTEILLTIEHEGAAPAANPDSVVSWLRELLTGTLAGCPNPRVLTASVIGGFSLEINGFTITPTREEMQDFRIGNKLTAIRSLRNRTGCGLREARYVLERSVAAL